ncbi:aminotransferase class I/II-fold pyridoxal phosphate-dependent enzyme [Nocardioides sp.]|uniref:aminotransferase class I/II-fold pyridoxal phosphate-dependent enzyme n=1 Tax=Nocardioides sp. TaxID=35761 RepID=UPI003566B21E
MQDPILLSAPDVGEVEERHVLRAIRSGWVAPAGPDLAAFESAIAERVGVPHAVALSSGTAALHLALVSWGVGRGDVVPVSTLTFAATVNAIRYVGAEPHFVDCEVETGNISPELLERALVALRAAGRSVPVVVPVDLLGKVADHDALREVAGDARWLWDAAESFGASYRGRPAGSLGDAAVLSFNGNKIMTTSGGGMLLTRDGELAAHVRKLSTQAREPVAHYEHTEIGYNYRLSNILAALGMAQLSRLDAMLERRRTWRERYRSLFANVAGVRILGGSSDDEDNCWLTAVVVDPATSGWHARELGERMATLGVETRPVWKPMHRQPVFQKFGATLDGSSDRLFAEGLCLPSGSGMDDRTFDRLESSLRAALAEVGASVA